MSAKDRDDSRSAPRRDALAEALADQAIAGLLGAGAPAFAAGGTPPRVIWATRSALDAFGAVDLAGLAAQALNAATPGARELAELAVGQPADGKTRLHRLRFARTPADRPMTLLTYRNMASSGGGALFMAALLGPHPRLVEGTHAETLEDAAGFAESPAPAAKGPRAGAASVSEAIESLRADGGPMTRRFVWQTDAEGRVTHLDPAFTAIFGGDMLAAGDNFERRLTAHGVDAAGRLAAALASRQTWNGIETSWPLLEGRARMPVRLGASPRFSADQAFQGYRGFGVAMFEGLAAVARDGAAADVATEAASRLSLDGRPSLGEAPAQEYPHRPATTPGLADGAEPPVEAAPVVPMQPHAREGQDPSVSMQAPSASRWPGQEDLGEAYGRAESPPTARPVHHGATPQPPTQDVRPNVVALRPDAGQDHARLPRPSANSASLDWPSPDDPIQLSSVERRAFREIARALGARIEADDTPLEPARQEAARQEARSHAPPAEATRNTAWIFARKAAAPAPEAKPAEASEQGEEGEEDTGLARNAAILLDRLPVGVVVCRGDVPLYVNRTQLDLLGFDSANAFYASGGMDRMFRGRQPEALDTGPQGGTVPIVAANGESLTLDARLHTIAWDGLPATLITFRRAAESDATPRLRAVELDMRARESELRELHAILDTATDGVVVIDDAGQILSINRSAQAVFGYDQGEVKGAPFTVLFVPASHATVQEYQLKLKGNGLQSVRNDGREVVGRERQGGHIPLYLTLGRIANDGAGKLCAVLRDLTQFRRAEHELQLARKQAEKASELKSDFLAKVSHEVRTPLNSILGFTEVIMDERLGPVGNERYKDYLKDIHASGAHVLSLVNDLLDLSKIEAGKAEMNFVAVDANRVIGECVSLMQPQAGKVRVIMRLSLANALPPVVADERSLRQIILNLLSNAIKFTEAGGQIIVSTAMTEAGNAVIRVKDTGIGMNEEEIGQALEPFRQLSTARQSAGTGLGLPLTKALIEANRASLAIRSRRNEGTLVEVIFPATRVLSE